MSEKEGKLTEQKDKKNNDKNVVKKKKLSDALRKNLLRRKASK